MNQNKSFWDRYASDFDAIYGTDNSPFNTLVNKLFRQAMRLRFEKTIRSVPDDAVSVLDIGCGPGHYCFELARSGKRQVSGIDFSGKMLDIAKLHADKLGIANLDFRTVDVFDFAPDRKFDYSIMMGFIEYFEDPAKLLQKAVSITGRKLFISFPVAGGILGWQRELRYKSRCYLHLYTEAEIRNLMKEVAVNSFTIEKISRDYFVTISLD